MVSKINRKRLIKIINNIISLAENWKPFTIRNFKHYRAIYKNNKENWDLKELRRSDCNK